MDTVNLFGEMQSEEIAAKATGKYQIFRLTNHYRKSDSTTERCGNCANLYAIEYNNKHYFKCELQGISSSESSDIRLRNVCDKFKEDNQK